MPPVLLLLPHRAAAIKEIDRSMADVVTAEVTHLSIEPEGLCPLDAELTLGVEFTVDVSLALAHWRLRYVADHAHERRVIELGSTPAGPLAKGAHTLRHRVKGLGVGGLSKAVLLNVGLLRLALHDGERELLQLSLVVQVLEKDDVVSRLVLNPID